MLRGLAYRQLERYDDSIDAFTAALICWPKVTIGPNRICGEAFPGFPRRIWNCLGKIRRSCRDTVDDPLPQLWKGLARARQKRYLEAVKFVRPGAG